jgi:integrase
MTESRVSKKAKSKSSDGLKLLGREGGKLKYEATLRKKQHGKIIVDTTAIILADSKAEALIEKARRLDEAVQKKLGTRITDRIALGPACEAFLATLRKGTRVPYSSHLRKYRRALGDDRPLDEINPQELQRVIAQAKVSDVTAIQIRVAVRSLFTWAKEQGFVRENVALETVRRKTRKTGAELLAAMDAPKKRKAMSADELNRFLDALYEDNPDVQVMAGVQFLLGCRFGEVSSLRWRDIDMHTGLVTIRQAQYEGEMGTPKNGEPRDVAIGPTWLGILQAHRRRLVQLERAGINEWCFPAPYAANRRRLDCLYTYSTVRDTYRRAMDATGIVLGAVTHAMRHTMITLAQVEGQNLAARALTGQKAERGMLQDFVGHATVEMTEHYTHVPQAEIVDFAARLEQKLRSEASGGGKGGGSALPSTASPRK